MKSLKCMYLLKAYCKFSLKRIFFEERISSLADDSLMRRQFPDRRRFPSKKGIPLLVKSVQAARFEK